MAHDASILYTAQSVRRQPHFSPLDKSRRVFLFVFLTWVILACSCAIFYISTHVQAVNLGYKINEELQKKETLVEESKRLHLEIARLKSPTRIESEARDVLGLTLPAAPQVFRLSQWESDVMPRLASLSPVKAKLMTELSATLPQKESKTPFQKTVQIKKPAAPSKGITTQPKIVVAKIIPAANDVDKKSLKSGTGLAVNPKPKKVPAVMLDPLP
ncbi:MAG TPA: hypothetical protein DF383_09415 [Deltaproteobacteria bacterium]|nr:hypothetical protein [Deltaproteobacteria bacterium]